ncbi:MAG: DUF2177 family protein [Pseudomonadota bacterium]
MPYLLAYISGIVIMIVLDAVFLTQVALPHYERDVPHLLAEDPDYLAAAVFYAMYVAGVVWFVLRPALAAQAGWPGVLGQGALLGLFAYATFEITAKAVLVGWTWSLVVTDVLWGGVVTAAVTAAGYAVLRRTASA